MSASTNGDPTIENPNFQIYSSSTDEEAVIIHSEYLREAQIENQVQEDVEGQMLRRNLTTDEGPTSSISKSCSDSTSPPHLATNTPNVTLSSSTVPHKLSNSQNFVIGAIAGSSQQLLSYPLEYVKTMKQYHDTSYREIFKGIMKKPSSAWRGSIVTCICYSPRSAVRFASFEYICNNLGIKNAFAAGALSGIVEAVTVATISETIKTKYMVSKEGLLESLRREGFLAIYKGSGPMIGKQILNHSVRFGGTGQFVSWMEEKTGKRHWYHVTLGAGLSGLMSVLVTQPLDVLKSLQQSGDPRYKSLPMCIRALQEAEGGLTKQFYRGAGARVARVIMEVSLTFSFFDLIKRNLLHYMHGADAVDGGLISGPFGGNGNAHKNRANMEETL